MQPKDKRGAASRHCSTIAHDVHAVAQRTVCDKRVEIKVFQTEKYSSQRSLQTRTRPCCGVQGLITALKKQALSMVDKGTKKTKKKRKPKMKDDDGGSPAKGATSTSMGGLA